MNAIVDVQSSIDTRNQPINRVGIKSLRFPITINTQSGIQHTIANCSMTVSLPANQKGTHMSRFIAIMTENEQAIDYMRLQELTKIMLKTLETTSGEIILETTLFRTKSAPISGIKSLMDYELKLKGEVEQEKYQYTLQVTIPVTSLCPCSKEISNYGAHNQRSHVTVTIQAKETIEPEEVIDLVEKQASCQLYGLLKRPDEKYVTEYAYDHPKFVEDMVRDVAASLKYEQRIHKFIVESENFESIHNHSAYAKIVYP